MCCLLWGPCLEENIRRSVSPEDRVLQLSGRNVPFVNNGKYLDVTFDRRITWRRHIERTVARALRTYVRTCSLFRSGRLSTNLDLTVYKALVRWLMTYTRFTLEFAADAHLWKLQRLQNRVHHATGNLDKCTSVCELHVVSKILYVFHYINKLCRT
jgi:hypothetical protein